ncbi:MAG TPA: tail fiber protein [Bacteroidia bacterium]|jgi:microcystin-dependent protein|nr:tail fiber protein [Bacteroidia bacterium]
MDEFIGIIKLFGGNFAPTGWALCNGQLLPINQNAALFSILGTTFGGDGRTTFGLPDLRGRVPVGMGSGPGLPVITEGQLGGEANHSLLLTEMPAHTHLATASGSAGLKVSSGNSTQNAATAGASISTPGTTTGRTFNPTQGFNTATPDMTLNAASINMSSLSVANANTGGSQPHNNMQPYLGVNYIICLQGVFPSRS